MPKISRFIDDTAENAAVSKQALLCNRLGLRLLPLLSESEPQRLLLALRTSLTCFAVQETHGKFQLFRTLNDRLRRSTVGPSPDVIRSLRNATGILEGHGSKRACELALADGFDALATFAEESYKRKFRERPEEQYINFQQLSLDDADYDSFDKGYVWTEPLWSRGVQKTPFIIGAEGRFLDLLDSTPDWNWWLRWYQGFLDGEPLDSEFQRRVALIPDEEWEKGPKRIAELIEEIEAEFLIDAAPLSEEMAFDAETGTFFTVPAEVQSPDLFRVSLERAEFAFGLAVGGNGLSDLSYEAKILGHTFQACRDDPQTVEMNFMQVAGSLRRQMERKELPDSQEIVGLSDTLLQAALDIRATHEEVAKAREKRAERAVREATKEEKAALAEALPVLQAVSNDKLATEFEQDFGQVINTSVGPVPDGAPPLPGADAAYRIGNRAAKMSLLAKGSDIAKRVDGSGGYKAARIGTTLYTVVDIILKILRYIP